MLNFLFLRTEIGDPDFDQGTFKNDNKTAETLKLTY